MQEEQVEEADGKNFRMTVVKNDAIGVRNMSCW